MKAQEIRPGSRNWQPHAYQVSAAQHALYNAGAALFLEPGL